MTLVIQGANRVGRMADCHVCQQPKMPHQTLSIDANGRLVHKACRRPAWQERSNAAKDLTGALAS